jgi:hypothetical protein
MKTCALLTELWKSGVAYITCIGVFCTQFYLILCHYQKAYCIIIQLVIILLISCTIPQIFSHNTISQARWIFHTTQYRQVQNFRITHQHDLTPLNYILWRKLKNAVYSNWPWTQLVKHGISKNCNKTLPDIIQSMWHNIQAQYNMCIRYEDQDFEHFSNFLWFWNSGPLCIGFSAT